VGQVIYGCCLLNKDDAHYDAIEKLITENKIGGLIFFSRRTVTNLTIDTNRNQNTLFMVSMPNGVSMRLDSTYTYPWNMTLGAVQDMNLIEN
jgi:hypothetical protein